MIKIIKNNKLCTCLLALFFLILVYCHFQTFIINDDLPYSLYYRVDNRITDIRGVIANQIVDYSLINARVFIHAIVQTLLIFEKNVWSILNPLVIIGIILLMTKIVKDITKTNIKNLYLVLGSIISFLLLFEYKQLIYWVAGSVNYVWVFLLILLIILYYLKIGLPKKPVITTIICLISSMICEVLAIFILSLLIFDLINKLLIEKEKKITKKYIIYIIAAVLGFLFLLLAPSTIGRVELSNDAFNNINIINKLLLTIPVISKNIFDILNIYNIYPVLSLLSILYIIKGKKQKLIVSSISLLTLIPYIIFNNNWLLFVFGIELFIYQAYILIKNKDFKLLVILICSYIIPYSLCLTIDYTSGRPNIHFELLMSIFIMYNLFYKNKSNIIIKALLIGLGLFLTIIEILIYSYIGEIKYIREQAIKKVQNNETNILETKIIKYPFNKFHIDPNSPTDKKYWAYNAFEDYYKLPKNIKIKIVK